MIRAVVTFLLGALVLVVLLYAFSLVLGMLALPWAVERLALILVGLVALLALIGLCLRVFRGGGGWPGDWF